jgi:OOP family OmpA-OmpF porin
VNNTNKIALAVAIMCCAGAALAQEINPSWYVQPTVVAIKPDSNWGTSKVGWGGGLKIGMPVHQNWDLQVGLTGANSYDGPVSYHQTVLSIDALYMMSRENVRPYIVFGVGSEHDKLGNPVLTANKGALNASLGAGLQVGINDRWSLQADLRDVHGFLRGNTFGFKSSNNLYLSVGLNYAINPPPAPLPPAPPPAPVAEQPAPPPAPSAPPPPPPPHFEKVTLSATELFDFDSATLKTPQPKLDEIASALQADTSAKDVDINGYTDRIGSVKYNLKLSERRANAVRDYLIGKGVDGNRLKAHGYGKSHPVVTDCHQKKRSELIACLAPNRRAEVEQITIEKQVQ